MNLLSVSVVLVVLVGAWAQIKVTRPLCDSAEAEEAALAAQDYLNGQHTHGYKYTLNRIEDIKVMAMPDGNSTYVLEVDLLETDCHVLDPTPLANCTVRPKMMTSVEGDCDVVMKKVGGAFTVTAFKCKTEESTEDLCLGCPVLLPLNDTTALSFVRETLVTVNNRTKNITYSLLEVGRMSSQVVSGGPTYIAEYIITEANCTETCSPLLDASAARGICYAKGKEGAHTVDCKMFPVQMPAADSNTTVAAASPPHVHAHAHAHPHHHSFRHHKLTALHNPHLSDLLSSESSESGEVAPTAAAVDGTPGPATDSSAASAANSAVTPEADAPAPIVKRDAPVEPVLEANPVLLVPLCPGRVRHF
ncbi:Alpha-2-HS-glycoprotein Fetuin-A [Takifugu flavidus]|uniref:Alpha-2-HS-glycoprotein Fetuin-A n=2 Tax=Takifugu flavidus TaxID=433684 RepID=A0A5C6P3Y3_9TELE|nr:Alpha-2-HS-glycoprotein Fetuin-A [Takifugu flavidus]